MLLDVWGVIIDFMNHDSLVNPLLLWWLHFPSSLHHHLSPSSSPWWYFLPPTQERDFSALAPAQAAAELLRTGDFQQLPRLFNIAGRSCYVQWDVCPSFAPCCSEYGYCRTKVCLKFEPFGWKKILGDNPTTGGVVGGRFSRLQRGEQRNPSASGEACVCSNQAIKGNQCLTWWRSFL